ncbi:hypothetical protein [Caenibius sp. WL]|uniref:hypothetical protein n=1 Tax=Caenibius sp. WL TaxID=2872646 RepID=UPI001C99A6A9|nr:hypothetical protein [Caenibius sp. WL]QZP06797.1 hypothetical protein K5X80_08655 [Caenibius sp. WL]
MALKTAKTALAIALQVGGAGVFANPTSADIYPISQARLDIQGQTLDNDEYLGQIFRNAPDIAGKRVTLGFNVKLRPPGGTIPTANAFIPGRLLQAAKYTEIVNTTAIPAAPEAVGAGSTTTAVTLGATAAATANLYKAFPLLITDNGATYKERLTAIRSYSAAKVAVLMEELGAIPAANYQIPSFLGYARSIDETDPPLLSAKIWIDGHRFDLIDLRCTGAQFVVPTTTRDQAAYPEMQFTFDCRIHANSAEATPAITPLGAVPLFRNGDLMLNRVRIGASTFTIDNGVQTEDPPNPNQPEGVDAAEMVGGTATVSLTWQKYLPSVIDPLALADAQAQHPFFAQWGNGPGSIVQINVPDARLNYSNPDLGGQLVMQSTDLMIDAFDRAIMIAFPY